MGNENELKIIVSAKDQASAAFKSAASSVDAMGKRVQAAGKSIGDVGASMTKNITLPIVAVGGAALTMANKLDDARDSITALTGATGSQLDGLQKSFSNVFKSVPASADEVSVAIAQVSSRLNLSGTALEDMTKRMIQFSQLTKTDVASNVGLMTRVFGDWSVATDKQSLVMDKVLVAAQKTGASVQGLMTNVVAFGAPLRQMGFSFEQSIGLLAKFEKEGVNAELVMGSLRKALVKMSQEGIKDTSAALQEVQKRIKGAADAGTANALAMEFFGAKAGPDMAAAIREGRFDLGQLTTDINNAGGAVQGATDRTRGFGEILQEMGNRTMIAAEPLGGALMQAFVDLEPMLTRFLEKVTNLVIKFTELSPETQKNIMIAIGLLAILGPLVSVIGAVVTSVGFMISVFSTVATVVGVVVGILGGPLTLAILAIAGLVFLVIRYWEPIKSFFQNLWNGVVDGAKRAWNYIANLNWGAIVGGIGKGLGNAIIGMIESAIKGALGGIPGIGGAIRNIRLPRFAEGVVNFSGGAAIVGERGPEIVTLPRGSSVIPNNQAFGGGSTINLSVNVGMYAGLPQEKRALAVEFWRELQRVAKANGSSLPNIGVNFA